MFLEAKVKSATCSEEFQMEKSVAGEYSGLQGLIGTARLLCFTSKSFVSCSLYVFIWYLIYTVALLI